MAEYIDSRHGTSDEFHGELRDSDNEPESQRHGTSDELHDELHGELHDSDNELEPQRHGTSDEFHDPHCEPCSDGKSLNLPVYCYCHECYQFLCSDCQNTHSRLKVTKSHKILKGEDMPKSIAAKPPRFDFCDKHTRSLKDHFCAEHNHLICSFCHVSDHQGCCVETVEAFSKTLKRSDVGDLKEVIYSVHQNLQPLETSIETNITMIKDQRKMMLKDTQLLYDKVIEKLNGLYQTTNAEIETKCHNELEVLTKHQTTVSDLAERVKTSLTDTEQLQDKTVDTKTFLRLQDIVSDIQCRTHELKNLKQSLNFCSLSFVPGTGIDAFLSLADFGCVKRAEAEAGIDISVPDVTFPMTTGQQPHLSAFPTSDQQRSSQQTAADKKKPSKPISDIRATKIGRYNVRLPDDQGTCFITGMAITEDGRRLLVDSWNSKVKSFSQDMKYLSSVSMSGSIWDITVMSAQEAVVSCGYSIAILDISNTNLSIKTIVNVQADLFGIAKYKDEIIVTCPHDGKSVKMIDKTGKITWSTDRDQTGNQCFRCPQYANSRDDPESSVVVVTDSDGRTISLLDGSSGRVITQRKIGGSPPRGITYDSADNIYVCCPRSGQVRILRGDLSEERVILSTEDGLGRYPQTIVYDSKTCQLMVSYCNNDTIDCFKLH